MKRAALILILSATAVSAQQQSSSITYPVAKKVDTVTNYFGTAVPDPYRWMEEIERPDVAEWVKSENAITLPYLASLPGRDVFQTRITALYNYARTGLPFHEGGRWFYTKNSGLQRQNVWYSRRSLDGTETPVLDPNVLSPDGSIALSVGYGRRRSGRAGNGAGFDPYPLRSLASLVYGRGARVRKLGESFKDVMTMARWQLENVRSSRRAA